MVSIVNGSSLNFSAHGWWGKEKELAAAKNSVRSPSEGVAEGGGWGEEFRHARAKDRGRPRRPARPEQNTKEKFLFLLEEKIGRAQIRKCKENFFVGRAGFRHGGGTASLGVLLKVGSSKVQNFPPNLICRGAKPRGNFFGKSEMVVFV